MPHIAGFRLGVYVFKDAEIVDFSAPYGVFSVARRFDPELDACLIADAARPVQTQAGFTVLPNYSFQDAPAIDAFVVPGGFGTRQEMHNRRLHAFIRALPAATLLASVCTGSWVYGRMGLLDAGRLITAGGIASGMELGFHLLRRAGHGGGFISETARVMEYSQAYDLYRPDLERDPALAPPVG
jgi:transcriptional regulator GlxA family with amidase domain